MVSVAPEAHVADWLFANERICTPEPRFILAFAERDNIPEVILLLPVLSDPPLPLKVNGPLPKTLLNVAAPVLAKTTVPSVVNPDVLCADVPEIVTFELFPSNIPLLTKLPPRVSA